MRRDVSRVQREVIPRLTFVRSFIHLFVRRLISAENYARSGSSM